MIECGATHHFFVKAIRIDDPPEMLPDVMKLFFIFGRDTLMIRVMFLVTEFNKITEFTRMFESCVI